MHKPLEYENSIESNFYYSTWFIGLIYCLDVAFWDFRSVSCCISSLDGNRADTKRGVVDDDCMGYTRDTHGTRCHWAFCRTPLSVTFTTQDITAKMDISNSTQSLGS